MKKEMQAFPCIFTGYLKGETLSTAYASSDLFVFPSTTDTFGNVVLEAQASGLPVIVTDQGGPSENVLADQTGIVVKGGDSAELLEAMRFLIRHPDRRQKMGRAARAYMEQRSFDAAFLKTWEMYTAAETGLKGSHHWPDQVANL
jgi:glycosyltransferase involved in cell wall biosynthesis